MAFDYNVVPFGWLLAGGISIVTSVGLALAYLISRAYIAQTIKTLKETIDSQAQSLKAKDELALSLAETTKQIIASLEEKLKVMTDERDGYRDTLHEERKPAQANVLKIQELELRPDLNKILQKEEAWHEQRELFYKNMAENQTAIINTQRDTLDLIHKIKTNVDDELKQSNEVCSQVGKALADIINKMDDREDAAAERDKGITNLLTELLKHFKTANGAPAIA